jgi:pantoate--beta-alanine ligase
VREAAAAGEADAARLVTQFTNEVAAAGGRVEYAEFRDPETLAEAATLSDKTLFAVSVWFGDVRLIDNAIVERGQMPRLASGERR